MIKTIVHRIIDYILYKLRFKLYELHKNTENDLKNEHKKRLKKNISIIGQDVRFNGRIVISNPRMTTIGSNVHIGDNAFFSTEGGLVIGDNVHFSRNITIYTTSHNYEGGLPYNHELISKMVIIKKNAWIGMNVSITPGVTIGEGAIVGLGAVITKDVPDFSIVGNQPYRILKTRNVKNYNILKREEKIGGINGDLIDIRHSERITGQELGDKLFFIVSTGRSGTTSLAYILNQHPDIDCKHEMTDILISLSTRYAYNEISKKEVKTVLEEIYCESKIFHKDKWFGESNQKLSNLIPILHELLPKAKFIWLLRDGKKVVDSTYARNWYNEKHDSLNSLRNPKIINWLNYRLLGYKTGDLSKKEWDKMTRFEKNCWYWKKWNQIIETGLENIPESQKAFLKLEELNENLEFLNNFLGLNDDFGFKEEIMNKTQHDLKGIEQWNNDEKNAFRKYCSDFYSRFYQ